MPARAAGGLLLAGHGYKATHALSNCYYLAPAQTQ